MGAQPSMRHLFELLSDQVDAGRWWPADTRFEVLVGAILVQNTTWTNVERALERLRAARLLAPEAIASTDIDDLASAIRPCGYHRTKAAYLKEASTWFQLYDLEATTSPTLDVRNRLLTVKGIGMETADVLLLYIYNRPLFIYDTYARRLLKASGFGDHATYAAAKTAVDPLVDDANFSVDELGAFHGLIIESGKLARRLGGWDACVHMLESGTLGRQWKDLRSRTN